MLFLRGRRRQLTAGAATVALSHLLNGTILTSKLPDAFDYHVVVPTSLNDSEYTNLPNGTHQVVVLQRSDSSKPIAIEPGADDIHFASKVDGPLVGNIQIQPIEELLTPPGNLTALLSEEDDDLKGLHEALDNAQLRPALESTRGITLFAPESGVSGERALHPMSVMAHAPPAGLFAR